MTLQEFIAKKPTRQQIADQICAVANNNVLWIDDTFVWEHLSYLGCFQKEDFYDDQEETMRIYPNGWEAINVYGIVNWKLKPTFTL
jgi:hypothetical protein